MITVRTQGAFTGQFVGRVLRDTRRSGGIEVDLDTDAGVRALGAAPPSERQSECLLRS